MGEDKKLARTKSWLGDISLIEWVYQKVAWLLVPGFGSLTVWLSTLTDIVRLFAPVSYLLLAMVSATIALFTAVGIRSLLKPAIDRRSVECRKIGSALSGTSSKLRLAIFHGNVDTARDCISEAIALLGSAKKLGLKAHSIDELKTDYRASQELSTYGGFVAQLAGQIGASLRAENIQYANELLQGHAAMYAGYLEGLNGKG